jgi:site-specific recombinase XerD
MQKAAFALGLAGLLLATSFSTASAAITVPPVPHVLRHSFASLAADLGLADSTIAGMIGHMQQSVTSRYLHLDKALISAAEIVANETLRLMKG